MDIIANIEVITILTVVLWPKKTAVCIMNRCISMMIHADMYDDNHSISDDTSDMND